LWIRDLREIRTRQGRRLATPALGEDPLLLAQLSPSGNEDRPDIHPWRRGLHALSELISGVLGVYARFAGVSHVLQTHQRIRLRTEAG